jgi:hypothetical protein
LPARVAAARPAHRDQDGLPEMSIYQVALFVHVAAAMAAFVGVGAWFFVVLALRRVRAVAEVTILAPIFRVGGIVGVTGILILSVAGLDMAVSTRSLGLGWVQVAIGAFAVLAPVGPLVVAPRLVRVFREAGLADEGPLSPALLARLRDPIPKLALHVIFGDLVGIVLIMTAKPSLTGSIVAIAVFIVASLVLALPPVGKATWAFVDGFANLEESSPVYRWFGGDR